jgi:hypothetical protein
MHKSPDPKYLSLLIEAGFQLIPLRQWDAIGPRGRKVGKAPIGSDWWSRPSMDIEQAAAHMAESGNIGIALGKPLGDKYLCAYDIDLDNLPTGVDCLKPLLGHIAEDIGVLQDELVIHESGSGGRHVFFLSDEADLAGHTDIDGVKVEVKSQGQQVVAPGSVHPDTARLYQVSPDSAAHENLPVAPDALVARLRKPTVSNAGTRILPPSRVMWIAEQIKAAIDIGVDIFESHDDWISGGMAFHAASGGDDYGLDAWISCSHEGETDHCAYRWRTFGDGEITDRTLNHYLANAGADPAQAPSLTPEEVAEFVVPDFAELDEDDPVERPKRVLLSLSELLDLPEPEWLVERAIPRNGLVVLYGPPKSAKTFLALDVGLSVASGRDSVYRLACKSGKVLYVLAEGGAKMMGNRARAWLAREGIESSPDFALFPYSVSLGNRKSVDELLELAGIEWDLVIFDTLARCMDGDENSVKDMNLAIKGCDYIRVRTGAAVLIVHHSGKDQSKGMRGSTALLGAIDGSMRMKPMGNNAIELSVPELRHGEPPEPRMLKLESTCRSAILVEGYGSDLLNPGAQTLEAVSHLQDRTSRADATRYLANEFSIDVRSARRRISSHIPLGSDAVASYGGKSIWREKVEDAASPNSELIRVILQEQSGA